MAESASDNASTVNGQPRGETRPDAQGTARDGETAPSLGPSSRQVTHSLRSSLGTLGNAAVETGTWALRWTTSCFIAGEASLKLLKETLFTIQVVLRHGRQSLQSTSASRPTTSNAGHRDTIAGPRPDGSEYPRIFALRRSDPTAQGLSPGTFNIGGSTYNMSMVPFDSVPWDDPSIGIPLSDILSDEEPRGSFGGPRETFGGPSGAFGGPTETFGGPRGPFGGTRETVGGPSGAFGGPTETFGGPRGPFGGTRETVGGPRVPFGGVQPDDSIDPSQFAQGFATRLARTTNQPVESNTPQSHPTEPVPVAETEQNIPRTLIPQDGSAGTHQPPSRHRQAPPSHEEDDDDSESVEIIVSTLNNPHSGQTSTVGDVVGFPMPVTESAEPHDGGLQAGAETVALPESAPDSEDGDSGHSGEQ